MTEDNVPIDTIDYLMIKWKKLASWESPKTSAATVGIVTLIYWYLNWTDATTTNLILSAILYIYLSSTFAQTIWPEIRSDDQSNSQVHGNEDEVSVSEISFMIEGTKNYYTVLKDLRSDSPGLFCVFTCGFLMLLGYAGTYFTILPLMYAITICGLVMPVALRKSPWMVQQIVKYSYVVGHAVEEIRKKQIHIVWIDYFKQYLNQIMDKTSSWFHVIKQKTIIRKNLDKNVGEQEGNELKENDGDLQNKEVEERAEHTMTNKEDEENVEDQIVKQVDETSEDVLEKIDNNNSIEQQQDQQNVSANSN